MERIEVIVFCGPNNKHNELIVEQLEVMLKRKEKEIYINPLHSLKEVASYIKAVSYSVGLISYCSNLRGIMTEGINIVNEYELHIVGAKRLNLYKNSINVSKDYFVVSSGKKKISNFAKGWKSIIIAEKRAGKKFDFLGIERALIKNRISYSLSKWKIKKGCFYLEVNYHASRLNFLLKLSDYKVKILGPYKLLRTTRNRNKRRGNK